MSNAIIQREDIIMCRIHMLLLLYQTRVSAKIEYQQQNLIIWVEFVYWTSFHWTQLNIEDESPTIYYDHSEF